MEKRLFDIEIVKSKAEQDNMTYVACQIVAEDIDSAFARAKELVAENGFLRVSKIEQVGKVEVV